MKNSRRKSNHLLGQTSPYLLQHLNNPVDWYPWGDEALLKARAEDKPLLVSIGYSACHWCHVMEKESFEDDEVAVIMNRDFVCIKVDREERPDIDHLYMTAVQMLSGQGGWPLNCFALPDTRPFWGGTYFPKEQWISILEQVANLYKTKKDDLTDQAEKLTAGVADLNFIEKGKPGASFGQMDTALVFSNIMDNMDREEGGTLRAPKFPLPVNLEFLLHYYYHSGDTSALDQVELSLMKMAMGGIYDQAGGGFARYSTDEIWKVPHFEKMLYDNGQLISIYSKAWAVLKRSLFRDVVYQTIDFTARELASPGGAFNSALDADSEGEEGKFYIWSEQEIDQVLGNDSSLVKEYYQVGKKGYWENGNNILLRDDTDEALSGKMKVSPDLLRETIEKANKKLLEARSARVRPGLDNKILTSWNALMIRGLSDAYAVFQDDSFLTMAKNAAEYILQKGITGEGKIYRNLTGEDASIEGFLDDYALLIQALIRLYEVSLEAKYIHTARMLNEYVLAQFNRDNTSLFPFSSGSEGKPGVPYFEIHDNVIPSSNSVMAFNLLYLSEYFEVREWHNRSLLMLGDISSRLFSHSINFANWGRLLLHYAYPFYTMAVCGRDAGKSIRQAGARYLPGMILAGTYAGDNGIPVLRNRTIDGQTVYYVCSGGSCKMPVTTLDAALKLIIANDKPLTT
jgi:uncharacterized protein